MIGPVLCGRANTGNCTRFWFLLVEAVGIDWMPVVTNAPGVAALHEQLLRTFLCMQQTKFTRFPVANSPFPVRTAFLQSAPLSCKLATVSLQAEDEARSVELRQQGNAAFTQGELHQALAWYWQAVALNPGDTAVLNNISLACFKQGDVQQVWLAAAFAD
jgi:hypothetical protein